jgi:hypothetical protein
MVPADVLRKPRTQNGRSSSSCGGASSCGGGPLSDPPWNGAVLDPPPADWRGADGGYGLGEPSRDGQITPSHPGPPRSFGLFRHLKSGARGLRLLSRSSHIGPPQMGQSGIPAAVVALAAPAPAAPALAAADADAAGRASRGGQITPSHSRSLHLKSGALGLRLPARLSHIGPWHLGQSGAAEGAD